MEIRELKIGMMIDLGCSRHFNFRESARVEAVGYDWAVVRDSEADVWLLRKYDEPLEMHKEE